MKTLIGVVLLCFAVACLSPSLYSQKHKKAPPKKQEMTSRQASRGFSTTLQFADPKGERVGQPVKFGIHLDATYCVDMALGESYVPPLPPPGIADIRFMDPRDGGSCMDIGISNDFRPYSKPTQIDTYLVNIQPYVNGVPLTASWTKLNKFYNGPVIMSDEITGKLLHIDMKKDTSAVIPAKIHAVVIIAAKPLNPLKVK
jgi:hypothetical protein